MPPGFSDLQCADSLSQMERHGNPLSKMKGLMLRVSFCDNFK